MVNPLASILSSSSGASLNGIQSQGSKKMTMKIKVRSPSVRNLDIVGAFEVNSDSKNDVESSNFQEFKEGSVNAASQNEELTEEIREKLAKSPLNEFFNNGKDPTFKDNAFMI